MFKINENYLKLPGSYLFSTIGKKVREFTEANPDKKIIRLGIGDVTLPLAPVVVKALHGAVDEMGVKETFKGYAPDLGYEFLRQTIADNDYKARGADIAIDEIFISDGAKSDSGNIQEIFAINNKIAVCDPVYPVYIFERYGRQDRRLYPRRGKMVRCNLYALYEGNEFCTGASEGDTGYYLSMLSEQSDRFNDHKGGTAKMGGLC